MNSRITAYATAKQFALFIFFWLPVIFFSLLLIYNTLPYFSFKNDFSFIRERAVLFLQPAYAACFYVHIFAGMCCIGVALLQFSSGILKKRKARSCVERKNLCKCSIAAGRTYWYVHEFFCQGNRGRKRFIHVHGHCLVLVYTEGLHYHFTKECAGA